jgi:hypothetical protein
MIRLMAQHGRLHWRWEAWVGTGLTILVILVPVAILLGQANGYKLSSDLLHVLFWVVIAGAVIGVLLILIGIGAFRWLVRSPIVLRSPLRQKPDPQANAGQIVVGGRAFGGPAGGGPASVNWPLEVNKLQVQITDLEMQLHEWGNDATARKLLKLAMDQFPKLGVGFVKDVAGLFYAAHQQPRTDFAVEFKALDDSNKRGYVGLPDINRSLDLPYGEAMLVADQFKRLIRQVQNDSINEAKRLQK